MTIACFPQAILTACSQSHPFDERRIHVPTNEEEALKIGRSVAPWKPRGDNTIFDCKVLSRNHALLWFEEGFFFLKDTKSSNGTFVNNERLSKTGEESAPRQIFSGDILQFGVEIVENTNKVTYGCIIAIIRLFDANGDEISAPDSQTNNVLANDTTSSFSTAISAPLISAHQLFQLQQYIRESVHRGKTLEQKLATLENILSSTERETEASWQALINEDRLLSRIEMLEGQLSLHSKNLHNDKVKEEMKEMMEDRNKFETLAKDYLRRAKEEKNEALLRLSDVEYSLVNAEEEAAVLRQRVHDLEDELTSVNSMNSTLKKSVTTFGLDLKRLQDKYDALLSSQEIDENLLKKRNEEGRKDPNKEKSFDDVNDRISDENDSSYESKAEIEILRSKLHLALEENAILQGKIVEYEMKFYSDASYESNESISHANSERNFEQDTAVLLLFALPFLAFFMFFFYTFSRFSMLRLKCD